MKVYNLLNLLFKGIIVITLITYSVTNKSLKNTMKSQKMLKGGNNKISFSVYLNNEGIFSKDVVDPGKNISFEEIDEEIKEKEKKIHGNNLKKEVHIYLHYKIHNNPNEWMEAFQDLVNHFKDNELIIYLFLEDEDSSFYKSFQKYNFKALNNLNELRLHFKSKSINISSVKVNSKKLLNEKTKLSVF